MRTAFFHALADGGFVASGTRDAALTTASAEVKCISGWSGVATSFSDVSRCYAGQGVVARLPVLAHLRPRSPPALWPMLAANRTSGGRRFMSTCPSTAPAK